MSYSFISLPRAYGPAPASGVLKWAEEDFVVDEIMPVVLTGDGEHLWIQIRKTGCNTDWVAQQIARLAGVRSPDVGYGGLKDRHAVTSQWFSVQLPGRPDPDLSSLQLHGIEVLQTCRHDRKLRRGALAGNRFQLRIRQLRGDIPAVERRLQQISLEGVPNYFGEQRFGRGMDNLVRAEGVFEGRLRNVKKHQRGLYLSAARSWIFNRVLAERITHGVWNRGLAGDVFQLAGKTACFVDDASPELSNRLEAQAIHPTGPMWGRGASMAGADCLALEQQVAETFPLFAQGLEHAGLKQERRALRLLAEGMEWRFEAEDCVWVSFQLPAGAYATMVMRELFEGSAVTALPAE